MSVKPAPRLVLGVSVVVMVAVGAYAVLALPPRGTAKPVSSSAPAPGDSHRDGPEPLASVKQLVDIRQALATSTNAGGGVVVNGTNIEYVERFELMMPEDRDLLMKQGPGLVLTVFEANPDADYVNSIAAAKQALDFVDSKPGLKHNLEAHLVRGVAWELIFKARKTLYLKGFNKVTGKSRIEPHAGVKTLSEKEVEGAFNNAILFASMAKDPITRVRVYSRMAGFYDEVGKPKLGGKCIQETVLLRELLGPVEIFDYFVRLRFGNVTAEKARQVADVAPKLIQLYKGEAYEARAQHLRSILNENANAGRVDNRYLEMMGESDRAIEAYRTVGERAYLAHALQWRAQMRLVEVKSPPEEWIGPGTADAVEAAEQLQAHYKESNVPYSWDELASCWYVEMVGQCLGARNLVQKNAAEPQAEAKTRLDRVLHLARTAIKLRNASSSKLNQAHIYNNVGAVFELKSRTPGLSLLQKKAYEENAALAFFAADQFFDFSWRGIKSMVDSRRAIGSSRIEHARAAYEKLSGPEEIPMEFH